MGPALDPAQLSKADVATLCEYSPAAWAMFRRGLVPAEVRPGIDSAHLEWYELLRAHSRLCIIAPRFFGKSETACCFCAWSIIYKPGLQVQLFSATEGLASKLKRRVDGAVGEVRPDLMPQREPSDTATKYTNGSSIEAAGSGASSRGIHPDVIVGDDIVDESSMSSTVRRRLADWWLGTVGGMCHSGVVRTVRGVRTHFEPTRLVCIGTGIHHGDLLHGTLRQNSQYIWRRYAASFEVERLPIPPSPAVEVGGAEADALLPRPDERTLPEKLHDHRVVTEAKEHTLGFQQERPFGPRPGDPEHQQPDGPPEPAFPTRTRVRLFDDGRRL